MLTQIGKQLKTHPAGLAGNKFLSLAQIPWLVPLAIFIAGGGIMCFSYLARLAIRNPEVCWDRKNNPEPWSKMAPTDQYKFISVNQDYSKLKKNGPDF